MVMQDSDGNMHIYESCQWTNYVIGMDLDDLMWCSNPSVGYGKNGRAMCKEHIDE